MDFWHFLKRGSLEPVKWPVLSVDLIGLSFISFFCCWKLWVYPWTDPLNPWQSASTVIKLKCKSIMKLLQKKGILSENSNEKGALTSLLAFSVPIWGPEHVQCYHLMTVALHTQWTLSRFCLHSHRNEVLGAVFINHGRAPAVRQSLARLQQPCLQIVSE